MKLSLEYINPTQFKVELENLVRHQAKKKLENKGLSSKKKDQRDSEVAAKTLFDLADILHDLVLVMPVGGKNTVGMFVETKQEEQT